MKKINMYYVNMKLIRDYSKVDDKVMSVSPQSNKQARPHLGIIVINDGVKYVIPLSSPKEKYKKKSSIDLIKIFDEKIKDDRGTYKIIGVLNINNMIPVNDWYIQKVDLVIHKNDSAKKKAYKELLQNQLKWCRKNSKLIYRRVEKVYKLVTEAPDKDRSLVRRSVDFKKLEEILKKKEMK